MQYLWNKLFDWSKRDCQILYLHALARVEYPLYRHFVAILKQQKSGMPYLNNKTILNMVLPCKHL